MGVIATLLKLSGAKLTTKGNAPGKSAVATGEGFEGQTMSAEIYQSPGVFGLPPDGVRAAWVPIGGTNRYGLVLAVHNYQIELDVGGAGGMAIYSTTTDGKTVKASVKVKPDGKIIVTGDAVEINGNSKQFVTWSELNTALSTLAGKVASHVHPETGTTTGVSPGLVGLTIDISAAKTTTVKTGG